MAPPENYRRDIDGLRAVAVLAVVFHHFAPRVVTGGFVGVDVFFVISGYLITRILRSEIAGGTFTFAGFYERRARRIFPALFTVLLATLLAAHLLFLPSDLRSTLRAAAGTVLFSSNVVFWRDLAAGYFAATDAGMNPLLHTWSLAVEEQYYVLFPVALLVLHRLVPRAVVPCLLVAAVISLTAATALVVSKSVAVFFLSPFRAWELLAGSLMAYGSVPDLRRRLTRELTAATGLAAILLPCALFDGSTTFPGLAALSPVLGAAAVIHAGRCGDTLVGCVLSSRPMVYMGLISYSLYLWHWPLMVFARYAFALNSTQPYFVPLVAASLVMAAASYKFIERPFRRPGRMTRRWIFSASVIFVTGTAVVSAVGLAQSGYEKRFPAAVLALDRQRSPGVPFVECDGLTVTQACRIGAEATPSVLLWGDSHLLAWAPVLDQVLRESGRAAVLATVSACPPIFAFERRSFSRDCAARNAEVRKFVEHHSEIRTVLLAGYWSYYFDEEHETRSGEPGALPHATGTALSSTIGWLRQRGVHVIVVGPVPAYERDVPFAQAIGIMRGRSLLDQSLGKQREKHREFFSAVRPLNVQLEEPTEWLCRPKCLTFVDGKALYRDSHHLSVAGARFLLPQVRAMLGVQPNPGR